MVYTVYMYSPKHIAILSALLGDGKASAKDQCRTQPERQTEREVCFRGHDRGMKA